MDSTLVGVLIGSGLSLIGVILNQIILSWKEQKQWENQQIAEKNSWKRTEEKKEKEYLREIYQNSLRSLSVFIALKESTEDDSNEQKKIELIDEIHKWSSMLLLCHSSSMLNSALNSFTSDPDEYEANSVRNEIIKLSNTEESFFLNKLKTVQEKIKLPTNPDLRMVQIVIDDNYRKEQIIEGVEIPQRFELQCNLTEMSNSQREKLADVFFQSNKTIPKTFRLYLPIYNEKAKQIVMTGKEWQANLNPDIVDSKIILSSWEHDFVKSSQVAKQCSESSNNSSNA